MGIKPLKSIDFFLRQGKDYSINKNPSKAAAPCGSPNVFTNFTMLNTDVNQLIRMTKIIRVGNFQRYFSRQMKDRLSICFN
jgi:hypothetical protein